MRGGKLREVASAAAAAAGDKSLFISTSITPSADAGGPSSVCTVAIGFRIQVIHTKCLKQSLTGKSADALTIPRVIELKVWDRH